MTLSYITRMIWSRETGVRHSFNSSHTCNSYRSGIKKIVSIVVCQCLLERCELEIATYLPILQNFVEDEKKSRKAGITGRETTCKSKTKGIN